ncbi:hypothetical protein G9P44_005289 [Scheffersomyces stipitis]|nr:hypothetical protein G9P44_005289 [Scheffersomyces stipitis]
MALIFDIRSTSNDTTPIVVHQPKTEGIHHFQWISPVDPKEYPSSEEEISGGYTNSKQFVIFSKHNLYLKLFSIDCTHALFTILKPITDRVIVRPNKSISSWSVIASSVTYNSSPVIYHFYNEGSTSHILKSYKLPTTMLTEPRLQWSNSGNWFSIFNDRDNLYGFDLMIYSLLGCINGDDSSSKHVEPLFICNYLTEGLVDSETSRSGSLEIASSNYVCQWMTYHDQEFIAIVSVTETRELQFLLLSVNLLRIVSKETKKGSSIFSGWKQVNEGLDIRYRNILNKTYQWSNESIKELFIVGSYLVLRSEDTCLIYRLNQSGSGKLHFEFAGAIQVLSKIIGLVEREGSLMVVTNSHIAVYDFESSAISVMYRATKESIRQAFVDGDKIIVKTDSINKDTVSIKNWEVVDPSATKQTTIIPESNNNTVTKWSEINQRVKRNRFDSQRVSLIGSTSFVTDEFTDTFDMRKRSK